MNLGLVCARASGGSGALFQAGLEPCDPAPRGAQLLRHLGAPLAQRPQQLGAVAPQPERAEDRAELAAVLAVPGALLLEQQQRDVDGLDAVGGDGAEPGDLPCVPNTRS